MFTTMVTTKPLGETHIMPDWAVVQARNLSKVEHQQRAWLRGEVVFDDDGNVAAGGGAARRRKAKPKSKGGKGAKGDGKANAGGGNQNS